MHNPRAPVTLKSTLTLALLVIFFLAGGCDSGPGDLTRSNPPVIYIASDIENDRTLTEDTTYVIGGRKPFSTRIVQGATLTIEAGAELRFSKNETLNVVNGKIEANGAPKNPILMTADEGLKDPGGWAGIVFNNDATSTLNNVIIRYGGSGSNGLQASSLTLLSGELELVETSIEKSAGYGLKLDPPGAFLKKFDGNKFSNIERGALRIPLSAVDVFNGTNSFSNAGFVEIEGRVPPSGTTILSLDGETPYRVVDELEVTDGRELRIKPGVEMRFGDDSQIRIEGGGTRSRFIAEGTEENPITMMATSGNEEAGWWEGLLLDGDQVTLLKNVVLRHAGGRSPTPTLPSASITVRKGALNVTPDTLKVQSSTISSGANDGIACYGTSPVVDTTNVTFKAIAGEEIQGCD